MRNKKLSDTCKYALYPVGVKCHTISTMLTAVVKKKNKILDCDRLWRFSKDKDSLYLTSKECYKCTLIKDTDHRLKSLPVCGLGMQCLHKAFSTSLKTQTKKKNVEGRSKVKIQPFSRNRNIYFLTRLWRHGNAGKVRTCVSAFQKCR